MNRNATALLAGLGLGCSMLCAGLAQAAEPPSQDVALPTAPGETLVVEWTGTVLPGVSGIGSTATLVGLPLPCPIVGSDVHTVELAVPDGAYELLNVSADFHIEFEAGVELPGGLLINPDLALTVYQGSTVVGSSDGPDPQESVGLLNPAAGSYRVAVCPYFSTRAVPYQARLTLKALAPAACLRGPSDAVAHSLAPSKAGPKDAELPGLANFDGFRHETEALASSVPKAFQNRHQSAQYDRTLGLPTFLWARTDAKAAAVGPLSARDLLVAHARAHLRREAKSLGLSAATIDEADAYDAQFNGNGPAVVRFRQVVDGIPVHHRSLNVLLDRSYRPVAVSGYFAPVPAVRTGFALDGAQALATAWTHLGGVLQASALRVRESRDGWDWFATPAVEGSHVFEREPRLRRVYYPGANGGLEPAFEIELLAAARINRQAAAYSLVVSATDARLLHRKNLKAEAAYTYRTFADPQAPYSPDDSPFGNGLTPFPGATPDDTVPRTSGGTRLVTLEHAGIVTGDPWLPDNATTTKGNHVEACIDLFDTPVSGLLATPLNRCDAILGDVEPPLTAPYTFDYPLDPGGDPSTDDARAAAAVSLFYMINWQHDVWYNHGFDEVSGNAQRSNYGRGGVEGDPLIAQGQDASGRGNANMSTPADGSSPTMQQYLFDGPSIGDVRVTAPVDSGPLRWAGAQFGPDDYDITGEVAVADEIGGDNPSDGCGLQLPALPLPLVALPSIPAPPQPSLAGKIALVDRGTCNFTSKAQFAALSGAIGVIVVNNTDGAPFGMSNGDLPISGLPIAINPTDVLYRNPALMIRKADGDAIKARLAAGETVTMRLQREPSIDIDATLDNQIVAHEYFHYVHHRLTDSTNQQANAMSEGWGDINGFMLSVRDDDVRQAGNARFQGAYAVAGYATNNFFAGIRRVPYSTDFEKNGFTFRHIADGEPTPDGGDGATNSAVHNAGEIWANAMFECYAALLNDPRHGFGEAQRRMRDYIIGGFKMTPANATYTEARDAVLSVVLASDFEDFRRCSAGFAKRGMGLNAISPARSSTDLTGVVEDYTAFVCPTAAGSGDDGTDGREGGGSGSSDGGRFGSGAVGPGLLLVLLALGALRPALRRRQAH
jgi:hypothetical protein